MAPVNGTGAGPLRQLSEWVSGLEFADLSTAAVTRLKESVRDALGCAIFCADLPWVRMVVGVVSSQSGDRGAASIWGTGQRADLFGATLANGTAVQSYELDDFHSRASLHGSSAMLPVALALAEARSDVSGAQLLTALAAGWEVAVRLNRCVGDLLVGGWHAPTIMGTVAASAAAGRTLGLSSTEMYHCISLAILQASGLAVVQYGGMSKRIYAGRAAEIGLQSALFAEHGLTAPDDVLSEEFGGFLPTFAPEREHDIRSLSRGLGSDFAAEGISFKLYSCCAVNHPALDLISDLVAENPDLTYDNLEHIDIEMTEHGYKHCGFPYVPDTAITAQFSVEYCLAVYLLEGAAFVEQFRDGLLADSRLLDLVGRISTTVDPSLQTGDLRSKRAVRIRVRLRDGQVFVREGMLARGQPERPASDRELRVKFDRLVATSMDPKAADELSMLIQNLDSLPDATSLVDRIAG
jgi:aconitate decarboxylase